MADNEEFKKCTTLGELRAAIADLPDDLEVGTWDGDYAMIMPHVNGAPSTVYMRDGSWTIYGGYEKDEPEPTKKMLLL